MWKEDTPMQREKAERQAKIKGKSAGKQPKTGEASTGHWPAGKDGWTAGWGPKGREWPEPAQWGPTEKQWPGPKAGAGGKGRLAAGPSDDDKEAGKGEEKGNNPRNPAQLPWAKGEKNGGPKGPPAGKGSPAKGQKGQTPWWKAPGKMVKW